MAKDPTKHKQNYQIDGQKLNEYEFTQSHGAITEDEQNRFGDQQRQSGDQFDAPQTEAERIQQLMDDVHERVQREKEKEAAREAAKRSKARAQARERASQGRSIDPATGEMTMTFERSLDVTRIAGVLFGPPLLFVLVFLILREG